jgi:hypothetical protein
MHQLFKLTLCSDEDRKEVGAVIYTIASNKDVAIEEVRNEWVMNRESGFTMAWSKKHSKLRKKHFDEDLMSVEAVMEFNDDENAVLYMERLFTPILALP